MFGISLVDILVGANFSYPTTKIPLLRVWELLYRWPHVCIARATIVECVRTTLRATCGLYLARACSQVTYWNRDTTRLFLVTKLVF